MFTRIRKAMDEKDQGFTLIELLVVMIIIGILAAIAIPTFMSQKSKAKDTSAKADVKALATEVETALVDGVPAAEVSIAEVTGPLAATFTANGQTYTVRVSTGNKASGKIAATGSYCVQVKTADSTSTGTPPVANHVFNVTDGVLSAGACP